MFLGDRYLLQDRIARSGMSTMYRGRDIHMACAVAIKVLHGYGNNPELAIRAQREARAALALHHPNIVQVYDYGQTDDSHYYIVMELVEGTDLGRYLRARGMLSVDRAVIIAHDVALGLGVTHRHGIVHGGVNPQHVLIGRDGSVKLTAFNMPLGTVGHYYAPELAQGEGVTPATDVYALGIVMYEMLTGRMPFDGDTPVAVAMQHIQDAPIPPSQFNASVPPSLEEIILRCLEKVPEMRYRDGLQLALALVPTTSPS